MSKYKEYVKRMLESNQELFNSFRVLHDIYALDEERYQDKFNREGEKIMLVIKEWEGRLCRQSEKAGYSNYTTNLAEKFQGEVKKVFPLIDHVGIIVKKFTLKRILLE